MKTLNLHCDYIRFKGLKPALKDIENISPKQKLEGESRECLVVMIAVEKGDNPNKSTEQLVENIKDIAGQVKTENVVIYPYAHLSSNLGKPKVSVEIMKRTCEELSKDLNVVSAPFGYYKQFELKVKGHPLSELSREIVIEGNEEVEEDLAPEEIKRLLHQISKTKLDTSKIKENDHRIIGKKLDLWSFNSTAPGMVFWHPKGLHIKNKLIEYWRDLHWKAGYTEISTPQIMDRKLWEISGHWSKFKGNMFTTDYENRELAVKPMNCPGGMLVYKTTPKSYKDLPLRIGELGTVHRIELSGVLGGLMRVIQFVQDDAHIFCTKQTVEEELGKILDLAKILFEQFSMQIDHVELSTRPEKRIGSDEKWDIAEKALESVLKKREMRYVINKGDGAFYGPKIDFHIKDSLARTWQCSTVQLDFALPDRFDLTYTNENADEKRPVMIHRTIYGSIERFLGIYTEHVSGSFPLWLSPNQIKVITLNDEVRDYALKVNQRFFDEGFMTELDDRNLSIGKKAREAQIQRFNYLVTIGEAEKAEGKVAVRQRGTKDIETMEIDKFISKISSEISSRD